MDNTVVVAAAQRGDVVRIEVRGPYAGRRPGARADRARDRGAHGGVLQTHEVPGMSGSAYVLEVPGRRREEAEAKAKTEAEAAAEAAESAPASRTDGGAGEPGARAARVRAGARTRAGGS